MAVTIILLILFLAIAGGCYAYVKFSPKFNDVTIELGTETVTIDQFLKENTDASKASFITDIATIDYTKAGSHEIELKYEDVTQKAMLNIVDTVAPVVEFQNVDKYVDYELNADDFIKSKTDLAEMTASIVNPPEIDGIGTYDITVEVRDASNNVTSNVCTLNISRVKKEVTLELGDKLTKKDILLNYKEDKDALKQSDIDKINKKGVGEYELVSEIDGATETIKIIIKDTKAPELKLKEVTIYEGEDGLSKGDFISSVKDASDDVTTKLVTKIDYSKIGSQEIVITAEDKYGNKTEKKTGEIVLFLICYGFIDGEEKTQRALLTKIEAYLKYTKSAEFQNEYLKCPIILRVTFKEKPDQLILDLLKNSQSWIMEYDVTLEVEINNKTIKLLP